jgi:hypothetical protein
MEPVGIALGVVGLAGLFSVCLDSIDRYRAYKSFTSDSEALDVQLGAHRLRLEEWGHAVGIDQDKPSPAYNRRLEDPKTSVLVADLLRIIKETIQSGGGGLPRRNSGFHAKTQEDTRSPRFRKLSYAFGGKSDRLSNIALLGRLLDQLERLVPPNVGDANHHNTPGTSSKSTEDEKWVNQLRQAMVDWQGGLQTNNWDATNGRCCDLILAFPS